VIVIPGYTADDKVPGVVAINQWGAGRQSIGAIPLVLTLFGNKTSDGTANLNERVLCTTSEEADTLAGSRSELGRMAHAALDVPGVTLMLCPVEEAAGAAGAVATIVISGSWSTSGEITVQLDEEIIRVAVAASHTPTTFGDALEDAIEGAQNGRLFCTAENTTGTVVMTVASLGVRGNQHICFLDSSKKPAGMTISLSRLSAVTRSGGTSGPAITVTGTHSTTTVYVATITTGGSNGTAQFSLTGNGVSLATGVTVPTTPFTYSVPGSDSLVITWGNGTHVLNEVHTFTAAGANSNGGVFFMQGSGTDDIEDALDETESVTHDYIAAAHNDAVNVALIEASCNAKAAFDVNRLENYVVAMNGSMTAAIAIGQTGMNDQLGQCIWDQWGVEHPSRTAARFAALRSTTEGSQPNTNYDDVALPGAAPHYRDADVPNRATLKAALNNSLTPLVTVNGTKQIVRAICSRSLNGAIPDYRTYDVGEVAVPIRIRKELVALGQQLKASNPYAGPDVAEGLPPPGTFTPRLWNSKVTARMTDWASSGTDWVTDVENNLPESEWDSDAKRIMSIVPVVVKPLNHQLGVVVRQTAA
jgi:phage tail sheath gpL-like